jgi:riboflavin kinase/FMN adenylyltransferase
VVVSSTKIREFVAEGRVSAATCLLGRPFELMGVVERGLGRGRTIGFPTVNLHPEPEVRPGIGVYAVRVTWRDRVLGGAANIGRKPTFGDEEVTVEAHLFDFAGDLYGERLSLEFIERLRGEQRFNSPAELVAQIERDCQHARQILEQASPPGGLSPRRQPRPA